MNDLTHDPLAALQVSTEHGITEKQAETAMTWAAMEIVHTWTAYAEFWGLDSEDAAAMEAWGGQLTLDDRRAILEDAVITVRAADGVLAEVYRRRDARRARPRLARVMHTSRTRIRIR